MKNTLYTQANALEWSNVWISFPQCRHCIAKTKFHKNKWTTVCRQHKSPM